MRFVSLSAAVVIFLAAIPSDAAPLCVVPDGLVPAHVQPVPVDEIQRGVTTAYFLLALTWSPEWCRVHGQEATSERLQCDGNAHRFVLHGLWPNGASRPHPRYCNPVGGLDAATVRRMFCRTPSPELLQHEWQAHGSCGWTDAKAYFRRAASLYDGVDLPEIEAIPAETLTAGTIRNAFVAKNPGLSSAGIDVRTDKEQRLTEVRLCYDLSFRPTACRDGTGTPGHVRIRLTPSAMRAR